MRYRRVTAINPLPCYPGVTQGARDAHNEAHSGAVDRLAVPKTGRVEFFDSHLPGFGLRIADSGHKTWQVFYRINGKQRRYTIDTVEIPQGRRGTRSRARDLARRGRGIDPAASRRPYHRNASPTPSESLAAQFVERYAKPKNRSWQETDRTLQRHVSARWGARAATPSPPRCA